MAAAAVAVATLASEARGGLYVAPTVKWASFAHRAEHEEPTPNFYGYGGGLSFGLSPKQVLDLGAFAAYVPGRRGDAGFAADDASLVSYGGEIAARFAESVHFGLKGGVSTYHLYKQTDETELPKEWHGPSGGVSIGAVAKVSKQSFLITTFDVMHHILRATDQVVATGKRRFDSFSISLSYMFNSYESYGIENTIFKDFMDSVNF